MTFQSASCAWHMGKTLKNSLYVEAFFFNFHLISHIACTFSYCLCLYQYLCPLLDVLYVCLYVLDAEYICKL